MSHKQEQKHADTDISAVLTVATTNHVITFERNNEKFLRHVKPPTRSGLYGQFIVNIAPIEHPDFQAGSYYESTFMELGTDRGLLMMGGTLTPQDVMEIQHAIGIRRGLQ